MLARAGVSLDRIQLLGRWSSQAVLRYTQDSALAVVPEVTRTVAAQCNPRLATAVDNMQADSSVSQPSQPEPKLSNRKTPASAPSQVVFDTAAWSQLATMQQEMMVLKESLPKTGEMYVFKPRARVLHRPCAYEADNPPSTWRSKCGWAYGSSNFWRTSEISQHHRCCKKCFSTSAESDSADESSSSSDSRIITTDGDSSSSGH